MENEPDTKNVDDPHAALDPTASSTHPGCNRAIGCAGILFGSLFFGLVSVYPVIVWMDALLSWDAVDAQILSAKLEQRKQNSTGRNSPKSYFRVRIKYAYYVDDRRYESQRYAINEPRYGFNEARRIVKRYEDEQVATAYVDPDDANASVLARTLSLRALAIGPIGLGIAILGFFFGGFVPKSLLRKIPLPKGIQIANPKAPRAGPTRE